MTTQSLGLSRNSFVADVGRTQEENSASINKRNPNNLTIVVQGVANVIVTLVPNVKENTTKTPPSSLGGRGNPFKKIRHFKIVPLKDFTYRKVSEYFKEALEDFSQFATIHFVNNHGLKPEGLRQTLRV